MRLASISTTASVNHAPARIMTDISREVAARGGNALVIYGRGTHAQAEGVRYEKVGSMMSTLTHAAMSRVLDRQGLMSRRAAAAAIEALRQFRPDVIHLHILHGHFMHYPTLLDGLAGMNLPVVMTLHDLWPLTGRCCFPAGCDRWHDGCRHCPDRRAYPPTLISMSRVGHRLRTGFINRISDITLVAPSRWMAAQVSESALSLCPTVVIANGVDDGIFFPREKGDRHHRRFRILAVANRWEPRKHLEHILALAPYLADDEELIIIGAGGGLSSGLPTNVSFRPLIQDLRQLAALYGSADVTVSASDAESFGMTIAESLACGTPVVVPPGGALAERVGPDDGMVADTSNPETFINAIRAVRDLHPAPSSQRTSRRMADRYITLFNDILHAPAD